MCFPAGKVPGPPPITIDTPTVKYFLSIYYNTIIVYFMTRRVMQCVFCAKMSECVAKCPEIVAKH